MKRISVLLLFTTSFLISTIAHAAHHLVFISAVVKFSDTDCAVELTISADGQDQFVAEDLLKIDDETLASMESILDSINNSGGNNDTGDKILFSSVSFDESHGINADIAFGDVDCALLTGDEVVGFYNDTDTEIDTIDTADVSGFGADNTAISKSSASTQPEGVDLTGGTIAIGNNAGATVTLGEEDTTNSSGTVLTTCGLNTTQQRRGEYTLAFVLLFPLIMMMIFRQIRFSIFSPGQGRFFGGNSR